MELESVRLQFPQDTNIIVGQSHFIKTVEDICEIIFNAAPGGKFGVAFCEASGDCLVRHFGNDDELRKAAVMNAQNIGAGHSFVLVLRGIYPVNVLDRLKSCLEVCNIFCATANPVEVIVARTVQGRGILGVVDGSSPKGVEDESGEAWRKGFLRKIGYKF
jgi:hypothetical protein